MITRSHRSDQSVSQAVYSDCELYRYSLTRTWQASDARVMFVMLNPSTADEIQNDPTVERCERRARALGYGAFRVTNIFALRATDPREMRRAADPTGPDNDAALAEGVNWADAVIAAWGVHGAHLGRGPVVARQLAKTGVPLHHLGLTRDGHPRHPLYLPYAQQAIVWKGQAASEA